MSFVAMAISATFLLAAFFPQNAAVFVVTLMSGMLIFAVFGKRNGVLVVPLAVGAPIMARFLGEHPVVRLGVLVAAWLLLLWCLADIRARARGAPLIRERLELFLFAGVFTLFMSAFLGVSLFRIPAFALLIGVAVLGAIAVAALRSLAERARGMAPHTIPLPLDAAASGLLLTEVFVAFSFLPLSPFTLAAGLTVCAWALAVTVGLSRLSLLTTKAAVRIGVLAFCTIGTIVLTIPLRLSF